jgi:ribosome-associated toxin RatA of RatAB toxin-antitoxin module
MPTESRTVRATPDEVFAVLADFDGYTDWTPDVVESTVLAREGDIVVAGFRSPFLMQEQYVLEFVQSSQTSIVYSQVGQYGSRGLQGAWHLAKSADGTLVTGQMTLRTELWKSAANRRRTALVLRRRLDSLERLLPRGAGRGAEQATGESRTTGDSEALIEALGQEEEFAVRVAGAKYRLTRLYE